MLREWIKENTKSDGTTIIVNENISILPPRTFDGMKNLQEEQLQKNIKKKLKLWGHSYATEKQVKTSAYDIISSD